MFVMGPADSAAILALQLGRRATAQYPCPGERGMSDLLRIIAVRRDRARQRVLRRCGVRARDGETIAPRGSCRGGKPARTRRARHHGRARPLHRDGPARHHVLLDSPRRRRRAARRARPRSGTGDRRCVRPLVRHRHLPARRRSASSCRRRSPSTRTSRQRSGWRFPSRPSTSSCTRSSGFSRSSANAVTRLFGIWPAPAGIVTHTEEELRLIVAAGRGHRSDRGGGGGDALQGLRLRRQGGP